jgi:hypothetical protein
VKSLAVTDDVILHEEDGDAFLLHLASGRYFGLNRSGLIVWNALVEGADPVHVLAQRWPAKSPDALRADAEQLVQQLEQAGLVIEITDEPEP